MPKKLCFLVGAGKGLGNAIGRLFASHDFHVVLMSRDQNHLNEYASEFKRLGYEVSTKVADAAHPETLTKAITEATRELGTPDVFVYNVGITRADGDLPITCELLLERFQIDVASAYHCAQLVATDQFAEKKGAILITGGGLSYDPYPSYTPLSIDKTALNAVTTILSKRYSPKGIYVADINVKGAITPGDKVYDPDLIAKEYWKAYTERKEILIPY